MESESTLSIPDLTTLRERALTSAKYLYSAAQQVRNRATKLILKTYAQQRLGFANEIQQMLGETSEESSLEQTGGSLKRGWMNLQAGLTIRREGRQRLVIREVLQHEDALIAQYEAILQPSLSPSSTSTLPASPLQKQLNTIKVERSRLELLASERFDHKLFVRLFDQEAKADQVARQLAQAGVPEDEMQLVPIERLALFSQEQEAQRRSYWDTVRAGVLFGAGVGMLVALLPGIGHSILLPELGGFFSDSPLGILIEWLVVGAIIGAFFAFVFSLLISQDAAEDDAYLYDESLENGNTLLAVFAPPSNRERIEGIIGLKHQFEVKPMQA